MLYYMFFLCISLCNDMVAAFSRILYNMFFYMRVSRTLLIYYVAAQNGFMLMDKRKIKPFGDWFIAARGLRRARVGEIGRADKPEQK
jgi:hypothetical protein